MYYVGLLLFVLVYCCLFLVCGCSWFMVVYCCLLLFVLVCGCSWFMVVYCCLLLFVLVCGCLWLFIFVMSLRFFEIVQNSVFTQRRKDLIFSKLRMLKIRLTQNSERSRAPGLKGLNTFSRRQRLVNVAWRAFALHEHIHVAWTPNGPRR